MPLSIHSQHYLYFLYFYLSVQQDKRTILELSCPPQSFVAQTYGVTEQSLGLITHGPSCTLYASGRVMMNSCLLIGLRNMPRVFYSHTRFIFHKLKWCWVKKPESGRFDNFLHIYILFIIYICLQQNYITQYKSLQFTTNNTIFSGYHTL